MVLRFPAKKNPGCPKAPCDFLRTKNSILLPSSGYLGTPLPLPYSTDGRACADVGNKISRVDRLPDFLTYAECSAASALLKSFSHNIHWVLLHWYNYKAFRQLKATKLPIHVFVTSKLDYCNSLLYGLPNYLLNRLQQVQNATARLVCFSPKAGAHISPILTQLN